MFGKARRNLQALCEVRKGLLRRQTPTYPAYVIVVGRMLLFVAVAGDRDACGIFSGAQKERVGERKGGG